MRQKLGQHFLTNKSAIKKIIASLDLRPGETVIEIGSGHGELTNELKATSYKIEGVKIIAIEKDAYLVNQLQKKFSDNKNIEIIHGDALKELPKLTDQLTNQLINYKLVGNIPYYITGRLLRVLSELQNPPSVTVLTVQREVALRITSLPPKMNLLAASVQVWSVPEIVFYLESQDFSPPPEVDSAVIRLIKKDFSSKEDFGKYFAMARKIFKQPRKTILNNLEFDKLSRDEVGKKLEDTGIDPQSRPQNLHVHDIKMLGSLFGDQA